MAKSFEELRKEMQSTYVNKSKTDPREVEPSEEKKTRFSDLRKEMTENYVTNVGERVNIDKGKKGWQKYLDDKAAKEAAAETEVKEEKWWETLGRWLGSSGATDTSIPLGNVPQIVHDVREDESYKRPSNDWSDEQRFKFGELYLSSPDLAYMYAEETNNKNNKAKEEAAIKKIQDSATAGFFAGAGNTIGAIATAPLGMADYLADLVEANARGTITTDGNVSPFEYSQAVTGGISADLNEKSGVLDEDIPIIGGKGLGDVYGLGTSIAQSMTSAYTLGAAGTLVSYFGQGAASGVDEALSRGASEDQAILYGASVGTFEGLAEMVGVDRLFKLGSSSSVKGLIKNILSQAGAEGAEEGLTSLLSNIADNAIMQDKSNFNFLVAQYMAQGMSEADAEKKAWLEIVEGIAYDTIAGAVSGGVSGGIHTTAQNIASNMDARKKYGDGADLVAEALDIDASNEYAQKMQAQLDGGKNLSGGQINRLVEINEQTLRTQDTAKMKAAVEARLTELGESGDIGTLADVIVKAQSGGKLTSAERAVLVNSKYGRRVSTELNPQSIESGEYSSKWAENIGTERINERAYNKALYDLASEQAGVVSAEEESYVVKNPTKKENASEGKFQASEDGKTKLGDTEVAIKEVASVKNGEVVLRLEDGSTVKASDVTFGTNDEVLLYENVADMNINAATANAFINGFDGSIPVAEYALGFREAYRYGEYGFPAREMSLKGFSSKLSETQKSLAYDLGKTDAKYKIAEKQSKITSTDAIKADKNATKGSKKGKLHNTLKPTNETQRASLKTLGTLAEVLGIDIYTFESPLVNGKRQGANGWFDPKDNSLHIDLFAGADGRGTMLFTAAHELTHFIREQSPAKFKVFADFLLEQYGEKGISVEALVRNQIEKAKNNGRNISYDTAYEEVVADSCEAMLADGEAVAKIAELKAKDKTLWQMIKDFLSKLVARIKAAYEGLSPDSVEGRYVAEMLESAEKLKALWIEALVDASDNYKSTERALFDNGIEVNSETESASLFSVRYLLNSKQQQEVAEKLATRFDVTKEEAMGWISAETSLSSLILNPKYSQYLDYVADANEEAIKSNSDYPQGTVDFSNICKKRRDFTEVMNRVLRNFPNHVFEATDLAKIRTIMSEEGMEVACGICYVEDRRQLDSIVAQDFIDSLALYRKGGNTRPDGKPFNANQLKALKLIEGDSYTPSIYELISLEGRNSLKAKNPAMEEAWVKFNNARGMQSVRLLLNDAEYKRQILKYSPTVVKRKNDLGGLRIYSFSDMEMFHLIDIIQVITDSATVGLSLQGYTKVNEYAKAVKDTGEKLNRSLIPKGDLGYHIEGGKVVLDYDTVEGIDVNHPDFFDNIDNPNVGNIVIGINATQIRAAMTSKFIDQIIPFHTGQSNEVLGEKGIAAWVNYKDFQSERDLSTGKKSSHQINIYTEVIQAAEAEGKPITNKVEFVEKFLEVCKENDLEPRFSEFLNVDENGNYVYTEGYHKFLVDFKTFDQNTGEYLPQMPVKPIFENEYITQLLKKYVKSQKTKDADFSKAIPKVLDRITSEIVNPKDSDIRYSFRGVNKDGIEVYETSEEIKKLSYKERMDTFKNIMEEKYKRRTAKFTRNGHTYYALFDSEDVDKNIYGDKRSSPRGWKAKVNVGADGDIFELVENAKYNGSAAETGKKIASHRSVGYWDYFIKNVQIDGTVFDLIANVRKKPNDSFVYSIQLNENKKIEASPSLGLLLKASNRMLNASEGIISQDSDSVKRKFSDRSYAPTFYSYMEKVVDGIRIEKMGADGVVSYLKGKGVKDEEIKWSGIEAFLEGKKSVTKAELQEFVAGSQIQIVEQMSGGDIDLRYDGSERAYRLYDSNGNVVDTFTYNEFLDGYVADSDEEIYSNDIELREALREAYGETAAPKWAEYRLDGGSNYRELVFQLPNSTYSNRAMRAHWGQEAEGVLAHARIQDFEVDGKKMLFIEELQSDWHNEGHSKGYSTKEYEDAVVTQDDLYNKYKKLDLAFHKYVRSNEFMTDPEDVRKKKHDWLRGKAEAAYEKYLKSKTVVDSLKVNGAGDTPDAPFRNNYHEYVLKRLLRMAAEEGYDSIGWTPADIQSQRWSEDYAEGYRIEYDQEMPKFLRKYGKKWGASVGKSSIEGNGGITYKSDGGVTYRSIREWFDASKDAIYLVYGDHLKGKLTVKENGNILYIQHKETGERYGDKLTVIGGDTEVWSMDIPDSMKNSVLHEGQVMYSDRSPDSASNRSLLANALESVAQNDSERNKLKEYKSKIALIESEQAKLADLREKIKELSFAKGPRDTQAIKSLQFDANQTANRINTYDKQLLNLEATAALKGVLEREKKLAYKRAEQRGKDALTAYREKAAKTQRELMTRYQESRKKNVEGRHKTEMRHKIKDVVNELNQYLLKGTKDKHVPIELQKAVAEALDAVNMDTVGAEERISKLETELMRAKTPEDAQAIVDKIKRIQEMGERMDGKLQRLKNAYDDIVNSNDPLIANSHDEVISNSIAKVIGEVGNTPLRNMTLTQLESVYDMYRMVLTSVRNTNKAFKAAKSEEISVIANRVMEEIDNTGKKKPYTTAAAQIVSKFDWNNLKPVYAFERIGSNTFTEVFKSVRAAEDTWAVDITEAKAFSLDQRKKFKYDSWDFKKRYGFTSSSGRSFELSLDQIMSLYAYSKREQAKDHLKKGGIVFDETTEVTIKTKLGIPVKFNPTQATAYNLSGETLSAIIGKLTPEQKAFVDVMQNYLSTTMGDKGNEVSLELYGVKLYKEKHYFPLKSATQFMAKAKEQQKGEVKVKNSGFSKETVAKASNPIVLTPFMDVWADHVNEMSMYHAFVLPLEDFYRVYNYKTPTSDTMATESVEMYLQNAYGKAATQYIDQLLKDLNGGARVDPTAGIINKLTGLFKKSAVFASASVVVQQPSAIARAAAIIDTKYFVGTSSGKHKDTWAEIKKYAPVAVIKEMGYFDTGMGQSTVDWIKGDKTWKDKVDDAASKAPALADEYGWCAIWNAVKRETVHTHKDLKPNSEEFLKVVGERFTEVVTKTQVYDSVLSRSANMRSKDTGMKMVTAFMGEPTTSLNMLENAITQGKRGNKTYARKAVGAVAASMILNSILVSIVYAGRDDDEDKTYAEKYISTLTEELLDSFNPLTLIPFVKDIVSIAQGYDVERSDMAVFTDIINAWNNLDSDNRSVYRKVEDFAGAIAATLGLPVKNVMRDARGMYNTVNSFIRGEKTTGAGITTAVTEAVTGKEKSNGQQLYEAMVSGDTAQIARVKGRFKDQKAINSAIRSALRENEPRIKEAAVARNNGDIAEYMRIAKEIIAEKHFSQDDVVAAINSEISALNKGEGTTASSSSDKVKSIYEVGDYYAALVGRDQATAYAVKEDILKTEVANGKEREEAESDFNSKFASYLRGLYEAGEINSYEAENMLVEYGGKSDEDASSKVQYWSFKQEYPDYDLSEEAVKKYYSDVEPSGISIDEYYNYSKQRAKCKGTDYDGDGKTDSGSVKAEVLYVIDSLPITDEQKDVLYYLNGWAASTIHEAPWR